MSVLSVEKQVLELTPSERAAVDDFFKQDREAARAIRKVIEFHADQLNSVMNIDDKGNMGLQALSRQYSLKFLQDVFSELFPVKLFTIPKKEKQWQ